MGKKLKVKWVSETIGEEYRKWKKGDTVIISAQTGTGKTHFIKEKLIPSMDWDETMLIVCNRINLKRQFKLDLMKSIDESLIPYKEVKSNDEIIKEVDYEILDKIYKIKNIVILSYQGLSNAVLNKKYKIGSEGFDITSFTYIVLDECHFMLSDPSFNNKCWFISEKLIGEYFKHSVKIFMSATPEEVLAAINFCAGKNYKCMGKAKNKIWNYTTGVDYSYLNINYFKEIKDIVATIKNDKTEEKWLIFVTKLDDATFISEELGKISNSIIKAGTKNTEDLNEILSNSKFKSKVLICTKALDNGVNIKDPENLKHVVIMAWDRVTFIQELGRVRINIEKAPEINLYIPQRSGRNFNTFLNKIYYPKKKLIKMYKKNIDEFNREYDIDYHKLPQDIFYKDNEGWKINPAGKERLNNDIKFCKEMVSLFKIDDTAFLVEQTSWLDRDDYYNANWIEDVVLDEDKNILVNYLENIVGEKVFADEQQKLSDLIIKELTTVSKNTDYRTKKLKPSTLEIILREELNLEFSISKPKKESKGENRGKRYIVINKIIS
ncbi:DEAD/DEAH box helicase [Clostridium sp.]|uniref:DEAD/DEAH box helicase n=1 Tax=Clostridium sp. TaxID=1506 RepID=UPI0039954DFA